jgi:flagellar basal-body rod protein FlgG
MDHLDGTRFLAVEKNGGLRVGDGTLVRGMLESSNVDLAEEMTKVIESQRAYSMALKMVQTSDEIETVINNLRG